MIIVDEFETFMVDQICISVTKMKECFKWALELISTRTFSLKMIKFSICKAKKERTILVMKRSGKILRSGIL